MGVRSYLVSFCMFCVATACVGTTADEPFAIEGERRDASVLADSTSADARGTGDAGTPSDAGADVGTSCNIRDSIQSCGATCQVCLATNGASPTCDGTRCGATCFGGAPLCSDKTCSRLRFDFSSNTTEGLIARAPVGLALAVRSKDGNPALAMGVTDLQLAAASFQIPVCMSGTVDLSRKFLAFRVFFEGGPKPDPARPKQYFIGVSTADFRDNSNLPSQEAANGVWVPYKAALATNAFSGAASAITFQLGSLGEEFSGTVWVDDIELIDR
jgi:hypothetical protein